MESLGLSREHTDSHKPLKRHKNEMPHTRHMHHTYHTRHILPLVVVVLCACVCRAADDGTPNLVSGSSFVNFDWDSGQVYKFQEPGDLLLGAILPIHDYDEMEPCGNVLRETGAVQHVEALRYAVEEVNRNQSILPGITLGLVVLDDCATSVTALGQVLHFMPIHSTSREEFDFYPVVGVIGSESSPSSIMIANVLGMFDIPQISPTASSNLLSDKDRFPYFLRMVPPETYQVNSIIDMLQHFNWTFVSAVYSKGGYGESALEIFSELAPKNGICIGASVGVKQSERSKAQVFTDVINTLREYSAKVVILFTDQDGTRGIMQAAKRAEMGDYFTWIGNDGMGVNIDDLDGVEDVALGALLFKSYSVDIPDFRDYFESLRPTDRDANPWMKDMWAALFNCRWDHNPSSNKTLQRCDPGLDITSASDYVPEVANSIIIDAVNVFARALHKLITQNCPHHFNRPTWEKMSRSWKNSLQTCADGQRLLWYLRNSSFMGFNGKVEFDNNGDMLGMYEVLNFKFKDGEYVTEQIALWKSDTEKLSVNETKIWWGRNNSHSVPVSRCGDKCRKGQIYSYFKGTCCWECRTCRANEITMDNATKCVDCPKYQWPDQKTFDKCIPLDPFYLDWHHPAVVVFTLLSVLGILYCTVVFGVYLTHNNARLIKATSRELAYIILGGVTLQYVLLFVVVAKPSTFVCYFTYMGFNVSFTVVYAALVTRTNRIYRIFHAGKRTKKIPIFTSPGSQVVIVLILIGVQILINIIVMVVTPPDVELRMEKVMEPYVELCCSCPLHGFIIALSFNVILVIICSYYAFKTRMLPDNFNESRYISLCVYTTLLIWLAFLPSFFTATQAFYELILLSCALILNASVILICLYTPRIYAIYTGQVNVKLSFNSAGKNSNSVAYHPPRTSELATEDQRTDLDLTDFGNTNSNSDSQGSQV